MTTEDFDELELLVSSLTKAQVQEFEAFLLTTNSGGTIMRWLMNKLREWALPS